MSDNMKTQLLKPEQNISLKPKENTQYVLIPEGEVSVDIVLENKGIDVELIVPYILKGNDTVALKTLSKHTVPNTSCKVEIGCVLYDSSESDYLGTINVQKNAQESKSSLNDKAIVMGESVKNSSQPILEIEANDVIVSHGATTGSIQDDQLFYLMSRGFSEEEAEKLLIKAFLAHLLDNINDERIKEKVQQKLYV